MRNAIYRVMTDQGNGVAHSLLAAGLGVLSRLYGCLMPAVRAVVLRRAQRSPVKVISVGNLTVGGTGKTSLVIYVVRALQREGHRVAVVTRGYKRKLKVKSKKLKGESKKLEAGVLADEAALLAEELIDCPVIIDSHRQRGIRAAHYTYGVDAVVLDDGFQQWGLIKDLDIVCIETRNPFGNGRLLPRGILREEPRSLGRSDICVLSKVNLATETSSVERTLLRIHPGALIVHAEHSPRGLRPLGEAQAKPVELAAFSGQRAVAFSGIGDHASFEELLRCAGITVLKGIRFDDHHWYTQADIDRIVAIGGRQEARLLITTHKDAQRLEKGGFKLAGALFHVLMIELTITKNEELFLRRLRDVYTL